MTNIINVALKDLFNVTVNNTPDDGSYCTVHFNFDNFSISDEFSDEIDELFRDSKNCHCVDEVNEFQIYLVTQSLFDKIHDFCKQNGS